MRISIYVLSTCIPDENYPCHPEVFASYDDAEAVAEEKLRAEWEHNAPCDDEGDPLPYPGYWREANDAISTETPEWGQWQITSHEIVVADPLRDAAPKMLEALEAIEANEEVMRLLQRQIDEAGNHICGNVRAAIAAATGKEG